MSEKRPWAKPSGVLQAFGWLHCPQCNSQKRPSTEIEGPCAWCWDNEEKRHLRYVKPDRYKEWRKQHGLPEDDEDDVPTSPESRQALERPPPLEPAPDTDPAPFRPPIKREED